MPEQSGEKSQDPTPHRRQQAREKGQVAVSQDLGSAVLLVGATLVLLWFGGALAEFCGRFFAQQIGGGAWLTVERGDAMNFYRGTMLQVAKVALPVLGMFLLLAVLANIFQVGFLFVPSRVAPDLSRISLLQGFKRLFSLASVMRLVQGLFKVAIVGAVAFVCIWTERDHILALSAFHAAQIASGLVNILLWTSLKVGIALLILALLDYAYQRWKHEQDLRMTTQELREEMKNLQGDPQVVARRRAVQRQLVLNRLADAVPKADVIVTNPTELAVAIQYDPQAMAAPIVVAKGAGAIAARIRRLGLDNDIPIVEKKWLARRLYKEVDVNNPIPSGLYSAVAELLAYVYQLKGKELPGARK